jgi:hypothetical protein
MDAISVDQVTCRCCFPSGRQVIAYGTSKLRSSIKSQPPDAQDAFEMGDGGEGRCPTLPALVLTVGVLDIL